MPSLLKRYKKFRREHLVFLYFTLVATRWQAVLWGGSVLAVAFGWHFVTADWPYPVKVTACVVALFVAGYYVWRADYVRLIPKLAIRTAHLLETPTTDIHGHITDHRTFVQLVPTCLTEAPVHNCIPYLQRVEKLTTEGWKDTGLDRNLILRRWATELHPQAEPHLNVLYIQHTSNQIIPYVNPEADIPTPKFDSLFGGEPDIAEFRFYVQVTYSDKDGNNLKPVRVYLDVNFANDRLHPTLSLKELDA